MAAVEPAERSHDQRVRWCVGELVCTGVAAVCCGRPVGVLHPAHHLVRVGLRVGLRVGVRARERVRREG